MKILVLITLLSMMAACGGSGGSSSTVTVGGRQVKVPEVTGDEHQRLIDTIGIYDDPETAAYINAIGQRLVANSCWWFTIRSRCFCNPRAKDRHLSS